VRFLVDESTGPDVARWLRTLGHDVFSVYDENRGLPDDEVLRWAEREKRVLITNDKDFGELVFRDAKSHAGVVLLRIEDERPANKKAVLEKLLRGHGKDIPGSFVVVSEDTVRITRFSGGGS
jgi:predicted nuclease of predicted toxin-antitoxin system